jgi:large subunit ribosomal protein L9
MKVVFLKAVPGKAKTGEVKEVADGYARNFLIPKKLAAQVSSQTTKQIEAQLRAQTRKQEQTEAKLAEMAGQLSGREIFLKTRAGAKERLYGRITTADIAAELERATGLAIDKKKVELAEPIRQLGTFEVAIKLAKDLVPKIRVTVVAEEAD